MDPSEGRAYVEATDQELPPLYESVNGKDSEDQPSSCTKINRSLLPFKFYYAFFYGAIGSLFPFIALYFKHLWLSSTQAGLLVGLRPLIQSLTTPLWALLADRFNARKIVLFIGLCGWLFTHTSILLVPAGRKPASCTKNATHLTKRSVDFSYTAPSNDLDQELNPYPQEILEFNPVDINDALHKDINRKESRETTLESSNYNFAGPHMDFQKKEIPNDQTKLPRQQSPNNGTLDQSLSISSDTKTKASRRSDSPDTESSIKGSKRNDISKSSSWFGRNNHEPLDTWHTFAYLFFIILVGNLIAAPAQTMSNVATLQMLSDDTHKYGAQRSFGSIGWGVAAFGVGMLVSMNHDSSLACKGMNDINYSPCFYAFGFFMLCALVSAIPFKFKNVKNDIHPKTDKPVNQLCQQLDCLTLFVCLTVFVAGFNMGFIQTFLFWHLQSLGGTQELFSLITGLNAVGEMVGFLLSVKLISKFGHLTSLAIGLFAYAVRFTVFGIVENPWLVLTVELLKAFSSAAVWSSAMSFVGDTSHLGSSLSAIVHMLYWGIGYGGGGMIGGVLMDAIGARTMFLGLAVISLIFVILILIVSRYNCCPKRKPDIYMPVESDDDDDDEQDSDE